MPQNDSNIIKLAGVDYVVEDVIEHVSIVDSFVFRNKIGSGAGEAKLYIGSRQKEKYFRNFFGDFDNLQGCFLKVDFDGYLDAAKFEYEEQEQGYSNNISEYWVDNKDMVKSLEVIERFDLEESPAGGNRFYLKAPKQKSWEIFRKILLPVITYISILKLKEIGSSNVIFYFRPFLDYFYDKRNVVEKIKAVEKALEDESVPENYKNNIRISRSGQGAYRIRILEEFTEGCLITKINDERILIASHIKPWIDSSDDEKISRYNGLLLSPTYDKLFDQGFITFEDDGTVRTSPYISPLNWKKLNLQGGIKFNLKYNKERMFFLDYHRKNIFKGML